MVGPRHRKPPRCTLEIQSYLPLFMMHSAPSYCIICTPTQVGRTKEKRTRIKENPASAASHRTDHRIMHQNRGPFRLADILRNNRGGDPCDGGAGKGAGGLLLSTGRRRGGTVQHGTSSSSHPSPAVGSNTPWRSVSVALVRAVRGAGAPSCAFAPPPPPASLRLVPLPLPSSSSSSSTVAARRRASCSFRSRAKSSRSEFAAPPPCCCFFLDDAFAAVGVAPPRVGSGGGVAIARWAKVS